MTIKEFVGRHNELANIREWLDRPTGGLVLITGVGGIGKTSLMQKIHKEYSAGGKFVVEYFDLAEQPVAMVNQAVHLAASIGLENFPEFKRKINDLAAQSGEPAQTYEKQINEAVDICLQEVVAYLQAHGKRLLLLTDTFEIALKYNHEDRRVQKIYQKLVNIPGTCFVFAGRDKSDDVSVTEEIHSILQELSGEENILHLRLSGFDKNEMRDFFAELDSHQMIPQEMREKLYLLTNGRPILVSLAVEWLQKNIPLPIMIEKSLEELKELVESTATRKELLNSFEFELVSRVRQLQTPLDIAILYMAHIDRRMDEKLLSILLDMDDSQAKAAMHDLLGLSFVKEFVGSAPVKCTLHDEMSVLVNKYAWKFLDINGEERKRLTQKLISEYYLPRINAIKQQKKGLLQLDTQATLLQSVQARESDWERWLLEAETLYYSLKISNEDGYKYFDQVFYDKGDRGIRDQFLIDELKRAGVYDEDKITLRHADDLRRRGQTEEARQICWATLEKKDLKADDQVHAYTILGSIDFESSPFSAEANFKKALELSQSLNDQRVQAILHNNLGRLYRNTDRLEISIPHFKQALEIANQSKNPEMRSTVRNNLAWTYRLNGNLEEADALCSLAITENRKLGQERPLAYAYLTKADIDRDRGVLQDAERHARQALEIFCRLEDTEGTAQAYRTLANISRYLRNFEAALGYLKSGIALVKKSNSLPLLASLYQLYGRSIRHYATYLQENQASLGMDLDHQQQARRSILFEDALSALGESIDLARQIGHPWEAARSQIEIALITMLRPEPCDEDGLSSLLNEVWQTATELNDELLKGYVYENRARLELCNKKYLEAGHAFGKAACHIANRTGQETSRAFSRLKNVLLDDPLTNEQRDALAKGVLEQLSQQDCKDNPALVALITLCEQILASPI